ncbi:uncharacterized protein BDZ99DRAFT_24548, partial [Mytilinidion resinicola]
MVYRKPPNSWQEGRNPGNPNCRRASHQHIQGQRHGDGTLDPRRPCFLQGEDHDGYGLRSSSKFRVKFPDFNNDTDKSLELADIKALDPSKKRKAEETTAPAPVPIKTPVATNVISAPASVDVNLASQARQESSKVSDGPPRPAKMARKAP